MSTTSAISPFFLFPTWFHALFNTCCVWLFLPVAAHLLTDQPPHSLSVWLGDIICCVCMSVVMTISFQLFKLRPWAEVVEFCADQLPWGWVNILLVSEASEKAEWEGMCLCNCRGTLWDGALRVPSQVLIKQSAIGSGFLFYDLEPDASFAKEKSLVLLSLSQHSSENRKISWLALLWELGGKKAGQVVFPLSIKPLPVKTPCLRNLLSQIFLHSGQGPVTLGKRGSFRTRAFPGLLMSLRPWSFH